jgi:hypothetical protein
VGLPTSGGVSFSSLAVDPIHASTLYLGTWARGVFKSTDGGATWQPTGAN